MGILNVTPDFFSDGGRFLDAAPAARPCRGAWSPKAPTSSTSAAKFDAALGRRADLGRGGMGARRRRCWASSAGLGVAGLDRHHEGGGRRQGASRRAPPSSTTCGACNAIPTWRASSPRTAPAHHHAQPRAARTRRSTSSRTSRLSSPRSLDIAERAGMRRDRIVLDPGIGFGKTPEQSIAVDRALRPA